MNDYDTRRKVAAEAAFRARVAELGGTVIETMWLGVRQRHRIRCAEGHICSPRPSDVRRGTGICRICSGSDPATAEAAFQARVAELGGTVIEPTWLGKDRPHRIRCAAGHIGSPRPSGIRQGQGICRVCAGKDPATTEAAFRARVAELGGTVIEAAWLGSLVPHKIRCTAGHDCTVRPNALQQGRGLCRICAYKTWDVFYVVTAQSLNRLKFGITSGASQERLAKHRQAGYRDVVRLVKDIPGSLAPETEQAVLSALRLAGITPLYGREWFDISALPVVLDVADGYLGRQPALSPGHGVSLS
jgi:hypothetical protein